MGYMHLVSACEMCDMDWCQKASQGECETFQFHDGTHVQGPAVGEIGCDALTTRTPYCIEGSDDLYATSKVGAASQGRRRKPEKQCANAAGQAVWCKVSGAVNPEAVHHINPEAVPL